MGIFALADITQEKLCLENPKYTYPSNLPAKTQIIFQNSYIQENFAVKKGYNLANQ